ncbi:hypothetical protein CFIO01_06035 [Colletotrichum fioriniae PJ7]|uniref:Ankyrin repeat protein n=1 Tax=Colletotrichum fioriniae PJ7 TaxID=1445577 RepID=A0A010QS11_9PEZI|nr:hypothetical protein CFIO01_06035 [Colletotrichum fioriniae PJ7]
MRRNPEVSILAQQGHSHMVSRQCRVQHRGDASFFLAKYLIIQSYHHLPWNTNLATVINAITDRTMLLDGLNLDSEERCRRIHHLCKQAVHLPHPVKHYGIWDLFSDHFQKLLFPSDPVITNEPFKDLVFLAKFYLQSEDAERLVLSQILEKGPKSLSSIGTAKSRAGKYSVSSLMGSVMEAAIRSGSSNLAVLLINYEVNTSHEKITKTVRGKEIEGVRFHDVHFWRLAMAFDDLETMSALLDAADRRIPTKTLSQILLEAVCAPQLEILQLLVDNQMPLGKKEITMNNYYSSNRRKDRLKQAMDMCLEEAVDHGHPMVFNVLAQTPYALARDFYRHNWKRKWGFDPSIQSTSDDCRPARSLIEVAASRGDEVTIRQLLSKGLGPYGLRDNAKPHHWLNPYHRLSHLRGLMPMIAAAKSRHVGAALALIRGHFKCDEVRWLLIIGTVLESRDQQQPHSRHVNSKPSSTSNIDVDDGERRVQCDRDVKFWQELIDAGVLDLQHSAKGCQCSETPMAMAATHPTRMTIEAARKFVCEQLVFPFDAEYRGCGEQPFTGGNSRQFAEKLRTETGILFVLAVN